MENKYIQAMNDVYSLKEQFGVQVRGNKKYTEVSTRVEVFRRSFGGELGIQTDILLNDGKFVIVKATIADKNGYVVSSGLAEEIRGSSPVNKTSALENCETSAIGRALASMGLHGGQYASADEMIGLDRKEEAIEQVSTQEPLDPEKDKAEREASIPPKWNLDKFPKHSDFGTFLESQSTEVLKRAEVNIIAHRKHLKSLSEIKEVERINRILKEKGIEI